ncbi:hypothetical protein KKB40_04355 [Patescibacteria group bacterium]|nr:hypothetical protein [Patescibacteria group bacterium]
MNNKQQRLLELIEEMKVPLTPEEARAHVEKLSDEEVEKLISIYEDIQVREDEIDEAAKQADPEEYAKLEKEYKEKVEKLDKKYKEDVRKIDEESDDELDKLEAEAKKKTEEVLKKMDSELDEMEGLQDELASKLSETSNKFQK